MIFVVVLVVAVILFLMFWYIIIPAIVLFVIWLWWTSKPQISCPACNKKYRRKGGYNKHLETCAAYQNYINDNFRKEQERKQKERKRQEEQFKREKQERKRKERFEGIKQDWRKNWKKRAKWTFTEEEFWKIQSDIDERKDEATRDLYDEKDKATEKLWDKFWDTNSESQQERIEERIEEIEDNYDERIEEIEEEFEEEEEKLWEQGRTGHWYEESKKEKQARENYEKAKQNYKNHTGRDWHEDDWNKWYDTFDDLLDDSVNLDECYAVLNLPKDSDFAQVKKRYRELALKHHPDKCKNKEEAEKKFKEIVVAYEAIKNSIAV